MADVNFDFIKTRFLIENSNIEHASLIFFNVKRRRGPPKKIKQNCKDANRLYMKVRGERAKINIVTMSLDLRTFALLVHPLISASQLDSVLSLQSHVCAKVNVALFEHLLEIA